MSETQFYSSVRMLMLHQPRAVGDKSSELQTEMLKAQVGQKNGALAIAMGHGGRSLQSHDGEAKAVRSLGFASPSTCGIIS